MLSPILSLFYHWNEDIGTIFFIFVIFFLDKNPFVIFNLIFTDSPNCVCSYRLIFLIVIRLVFSYLKVTDIFLQFLFYTRHITTTYFYSSSYNYYFHERLYHVGRDNLWDGTDASFIVGPAAVYSDRYLKNLEFLLRLF